MRGYDNLGIGQSLLQAPHGFNLPSGQTGTRDSRWRHPSGYLAWLLRSAVERLAERSSSWLVVSRLHHYLEAIALHTLTPDRHTHIGVRTCLHMTAGAL